MGEFMKPLNYTDQEKINIINEAKSSGNVSSTAKRYNISDGTIHSWMKKFQITKLFHTLQSKQCVISYKWSSYMPEQPSE